MSAHFIQFIYLILFKQLNADPTQTINTAQLWTQSVTSSTALFQNAELWAWMNWSNCTLCWQAGIYRKCMDFVYVRMFCIFFKLINNFFSLYTLKQSNSVRWSTETFAKRNACHTIREKQSFYWRTNRVRLSLVRMGRILQRWGYA